MTDAELESRARRAYELSRHVVSWESLPEERRQEWLAIARAVLEEPPADPFEAWYAKQWFATNEIKFQQTEAVTVRSAALNAWNAGAAHEREECAKIASSYSLSSVSTAQHIASAIRQRGETNSANGA